MNRFKAVLLLALFSFAACATDPSSDAPTENAAAQEVAPSDVHVDGLVIIMTYYSDPGLTNYVGRCVTRTCAPKGTRCTGVKSDYFIKEESSC